MPRFLLVCALALGGCFFDADYKGAACSDGFCPSGLVCVANKCIETADKDAGTIDALIIDAPPAALTCADPGPFPAAGGTTVGSTTSRTSTVSALCNGAVMNGADAIYRIDTAMGVQLQVAVMGFTGVAAYVIAPCTVTPGTPMCAMNMPATPGNPINVTTAFAGEHFIVVDSVNAAANGGYNLMVGVN